MFEPKRLGDSKRLLLLGSALAVFSGCSVQMSMAQVYPNPGEGGGRQFEMGLGMLDKAREAFQMGDYMAAIEICKRAKNFAPGEKKIIHLLALAYAEAGDNYNANLEFIQCTNLDYNFIEARNNYGRFLMKTGKKKEAGQQFEKCITINPNYPDAHYNLGVLRMDQGDLDTAVEEFRTAIRLRPSYFAALQAI
ncbi:MAG TPA: tetratricopeptide repeat protein [Candidatus Melainabacteria bacterium]|nr:tetratricopeptide repeat protein [Candidatus Melainabacteria bacterium]